MRDLGGDRDMKLRQQRDDSGFARVRYVTTHTNMTTGIVSVCKHRMALATCPMGTWGRVWRRCRRRLASRRLFPGRSKMEVISLFLENFFNNSHHRPQLHRDWLVPGAINPLHPCTVDAWYLGQCLAVVSKDCTI